MTMQQVKNINKTDKHIHSHKKRYLEVIRRFTRFKEFNGEKKTAKKTSNMFKIDSIQVRCHPTGTCSSVTTVDSRYLEFDGTMENIRVNCSSTQEELRRYRKRGLFNNERETTRAKFCYFTICQIN
jgi:hypothetical protein